MFGPPDFDVHFIHGITKDLLSHFAPTQLHREKKYISGIFWKKHSLAFRTGMMRGARRHFF